MTDGDLNLDRGRWPATSLFLFTLVNSAIVIYSFRGVSESDYFSVFWTDVVYAAMSFTILKKMVEADTRREMAGYVLGLALGSQLAMLAYNHIYDEEPRDEEVADDGAGGGHQQCLRDVVPDAATAR